MRVTYRLVTHSEDAPHALVHSLTQYGLPFMCHDPTCVHFHHQKMSELERENFSLKLQIYHMEESMRDVTGSGTESDLLARSIDLKVQLETANKELAEKRCECCGASR